MKTLREYTMNNLRQEKYLRDHGIYRRLILLVYPLMGGITAQACGRLLARFEPDIPESRPGFAYVSLYYNARNCNQMIAPKRGTGHFRHCLPVR